MRNITISEPVFRDLIGCKSKIEDIKVMLGQIDEESPRITKRRLIERLTLIVYSTRYQEEA